MAPDFKSHPRAPNWPPIMFSVIIVNYNSINSLKKSLQHLGRQSYSNFQAIIVNNAQEESAEFHALAASYVDERYSFRSMEKNLGFAGGVNAGASQAEGKWIVTLNPDAYAHPDWLEQAAATIASAGDDIAMLASLQVLYPDTRLLDGAGDCYAAYGLAWRGGHGRDVPELHLDNSVFSPCGAAAFYRRKEFVESGGFCERYFCYMEDIDLAFRLRLRGAECLLSRQAIVAHEGGISSGGPGSAFAVRQGTQNMTQTFVRCMPTGLLITLLPFHITIILLLLLRHTFRGNGLSAITGLFCALRDLPKSFEERTTIQASRTVPLRQLSRALAWNPLDAILRRPARSLRSNEY